MPDGTGPEGVVELRTVVVGHMPLLVASVSGDGPSAQLETSLAAAGLERVDALFGAELPRGARVGFVVDGSELRLVDERDTILLRADRGGIAADWLERARELKGTLLVLVRGLVLSVRHEVAELVEAIDGAARTGRVRAAVVGVGEERTALPLVFG